MERLKQNKALIDVLDTLDKITSTSKKSVSDKLNKELIDRLRALGVKDEEAEII